MISLLLTLLIIAPHPDDEVTLIPLIQSWDGPVIVLVMTDGAATGFCPPVDCEGARRSSLEGFMAEVAPHARLLWASHPDGKLQPGQVMFAAVNHCDGCVVWGAGTDYGHRDDNAARDAANMMGWNAYDGTLHDDSAVRQAVRKWYGWLGIADSPLLGLAPG